jgi:SAM-dependent methyltransferase
LQKHIVPGLRSSQSAYEEELGRYVNPSNDWLDLGCGKRILPAWRLTTEQALVRQSKTLVGVDFDLQSLKDNTSIKQKVRGHTSDLPFSESTVDLVTANMVVEHLDSPLSHFREVHRILRHSGLFLFHTPNAWGHPVLLSRMFPHSVKRSAARLLDGRCEEDVFPTFYRANTRTQIRDLAERSGFELVKIMMVSTTAMFSFIPPLAIPELLWLRLLQSKRLEGLRSNLIVVLRRGD